MTESARLTAIALGGTLYLVGYAVCAFLLARFAYHRFMPKSPESATESALWGMVGAVMWPLLLIAYLLGKIIAWRG